jgi:hypothetical protein
MLHCFILRLKKEIPGWWGWWHSSPPPPPHSSASLVFPFSSPNPTSSSRCSLRLSLPTECLDGWGGGGGITAQGRCGGYGPWHFFVWRTVGWEPEQKMLCGRLRYRWEDNIMGIRRQGTRVYAGFIWIRIASTGWLLWTLSWTFRLKKNNNLLSSWVTVNFFRRTLLHGQTTL